jgi:hypothetical protein
LHAPVRVMDQPVEISAGTRSRPDRLLERMQREIGAQRPRCLPANDHPGERVGDERGRRRTPTRSGHGSGPRPRTGSTRPLRSCAPRDHAAELFVALCSCSRRPPSRRLIGGRGELQHGADRLDPEPLSVRVDERDHLLGPSSSTAKKADAAFKISLARRSSRFSRSSSVRRCRSSVESHGRWPSSISGRRPHLRTSAAGPSFSDTEQRSTVSPPSPYFFCRRLSISAASDRRLRDPTLRDHAQEG